MDFSRAGQIGAIKALEYRPAWIRFCPHRSVPRAPRPLPQLGIPRRAQGPPMDFGDKLLAQPSPHTFVRHMAGIYSVVDIAMGRPCTGADVMSLSGKHCRVKCSRRTCRAS